jgi:hypothetical protein
VRNIQITILNRGIYYEWYVASIDDKLHVTQSDCEAIINQATYYTDVKTWEQMYDLW